MLKTLRIQNFKGWKDTGEIKFAPITLFFGANSSGKSSIGQFLMMLKQTVESSDRKSIFFLGNTNSHVQLGLYNDIVYQHDWKNNISFSYSWKLGDLFLFKTKQGKEQKTIECDKIKFEATSEIDGNSNVPRVKQLQYHLYLRESEMFDVSMESCDKVGYTLSSKSYNIKRSEGRAWKLPSTIRFYGFPDETNIYYKNVYFLPLLNYEHENFFRHFYYLGPLRSKPGRIYSWPGNEPDGVGDTGENTVSAILAARDRKINLGYRKPYKAFDIVIADALKKLGLIEDFSVKNIAEGQQRREYEVRIRTKGSEDDVLLPDVGFGVSQVLPVLVACYYAPQDSIIVMEQPEIHLHPNAQAALADVMIDVINSGENGKNRNIQLIIETHSEHFLRRLQRRIAEDQETEKDKQLKNRISGYFVDTTKHPVVLKELEIDLFGNITNWPKDFFGDEIGDISGQIKASMEKRKRLQDLGGTK